jgi:sugar lactone lactonase YvrE
VLIPGKPGRQAIGLEIDTRGRLFVAGGPTGDGYVYDVRSHADVRAWSFTTESQTFVNDVVVTRSGAYFTDSARPVLYRVPIAANGTIAAASQELQLTGDYVHGAGFNVNGIDATPNGRTLVIVQSGTGKLFTVDPRCGGTREIALAGGATVSNGDGILLDGRTLYVVRNQLNRIAVVRLAANLRSGRVVRELRSASFSVPTTIDDFGRRLYAVNARFGTTPDRTTQYWLTQVRKPPGA